MAGVPVGDDLIIISKTEYRSLKRRDAKLTALEAAGVDNWEHYSNAYRVLEGEDD